VSKCRLQLSSKFQGHLTDRDIGPQSAEHSCSFRYGVAIRMGSHITLYIPERAFVLIGCETSEKDKNMRVMSEMQEGT
jgi:hypothetical protein